MRKYLVQNWQQAYDDTYFLFEKIRERDFVPDIVVGIARGGWIPARLLADFFSIKMTANVKVEAYQLIGEMDVEAKITQDINAPLENKKVLIVDDIADTGSSLKVVIDLLSHKQVKEYKIATLYYKERSEVKPDFFIHQTDAWVIFPWELYETIQELFTIWHNEGMKTESIASKLKKIGLPASMVNSYFQD